MSQSHPAELCKARRPPHRLFCGTGIASRVWFWRSGGSGAGKGGHGHPRAAAGLRAQEPSILNMQSQPSEIGRNPGGGGAGWDAEGRVPGWSEDVFPAWPGLHAASSCWSPQSLLTTEGMFPEGTDPPPHIGDFGEGTDEDPTPSALDGALRLRALPPCL